MAETTIADVVVPSIFTPYVQQLTEQKANIIQSGVVTRDAAIDALLAGGGLTFQVPSFKDLDASTDNVSTDATGSTSTPDKIGTAQETAVRLSRNYSWSSMDLVQALAGKDPLEAIASRVAFYWTRRMQALFVATVTGLFADNAAAPTGVDTHLINDMTVDIKGGAYSAGVTDFSAEAFIDAATTMGDSASDITMIMVHSVVYAKMQKNNLIDFIPDSQGVVNIPTFLGRRVIVDDALPAAAGVYESWLFGNGAFRMGVGTPKVPTEVFRYPDRGNGGGQESLFNRVEWCLHPVGNKYIGTPANGGPSNANTANNLANAGSWARVFPERKQIKIARLVTRES